MLKHVLGWQAKIETFKFREIVKRLQAFGLVRFKIEHSKIVDNIYLNLGCVYKDDIVNGFKNKDFVLKVSSAFNSLKDLFQATQDAIDM